MAAHGTVRPVVARFWSGSIVAADAAATRWFTESDYLPQATGDGSGFHKIQLTNLSNKQLRLIMVLAGGDKGGFSDPIVRVESIGSDPVEVEAPEGHHFTSYLALFYADDSDVSPDVPTGSVTVRAFQYASDETGV